MRCEFSEIIIVNFFIQIKPGWKCTLDFVLLSVSFTSRGEFTVFFCDISIIGSTLGWGSNFLEVELDASLNFSILPFGIFVDQEVIGCQGDLFPAMQQLNSDSLISKNFKDNHYKYLCVNIFLGEILTSPEICNKYSLVQFLRET
jgi:hypothetical protein